MGGGLGDLSNPSTRSDAKSRRRCQGIEGRGGGLARKKGVPGRGQSLPSCPGFFRGAPATWLVPTSHFGSSDVLITLSLALQIRICRMGNIYRPELTPKKVRKSVSSSGAEDDFANSFRVQKRRQDCFAVEEDDAKVHASAADPIFRLGWSASP